MTLSRSIDGEPVVRLRALEPEDLDLFYAIENDPSVWDFTQSAQPYSRFAARRYLESMPQDFFQSGELRLVIERADGWAVGFADLVGYAPVDGRAEVCMALHHDHRQKGLGTAALAALEDFCRDRLRLRLLYAYVSVHGNEVCNSLFRRLGYERVAILPQWHARGVGYEDIGVYQKLLRNSA